MASTATGATGWYRGRVKVVPSGDCLVIVAVASSKPGPMPEKTITLSSLMAPRLARRDDVDEPFAWESRVSMEALHREGERCKKEITDMCNKKGRLVGTYCKCL